ncbi:hypothetical protein RJ641_032376 [Dillenia turbinata]|uniref:NAD-dependent epimerase/dehydratase domain-containing protein n=1 Tax=Dillenia turbinata TaxID=194707 RepID=A0AAN8ZLS3_9MAGN
MNSDSPNMGYVGQTVSGTCTSIVKKKLEEIGFNVYHFNANEPGLEVLDSLKYLTHLVVSIPSVLLRHQDFLRSALVDGNLRWLCYFSSTSVYGNCVGAWIVENHPVNPTRKVAKARFAAEQGWSQFGHHLGLHVHTFRLGGIYGPGRRMRTRRSYTSRIHVADVCQAFKACISKPFLGNIYNIVNDNPVPTAEVFAFARDLMEKKWPGHIKQFKFADQIDQDTNN